RQLENGEGMGLARAAELNSYPGPRHVLELAGELALSVEQRARVEAIHDRMLAAAQRLGAAIIDKERHLDRRFAHHHLDEAALRQLTAAIGALYGELRFAHLRAHLETVEVLHPEQVAADDRLRGYAP
ncbi:MAG TPA: periplasmic heavy metal sensor, partial [Thermoanaerobaculia bacterium]|nr:periplasmic heavy metal sensor [Thermoanaerobaculia bacterium]